MHGDCCSAWLTTTWRLAPADSHLEPIVSLAVDPILLPAHSQASLIAQRELSARELLSAAIAQYERLNPALNAVVVERIDDAQAMARAADQAVVDGQQLGPFHGLPLTVKEVMDWVGTPSTWGDPAHADYYPNRNAVVVDRLLAGGAVLWGKTNVPLELGEWQTFNAVYGRSNNPYDLAHTPGGSSGASAASLAVGMASLEVGSDIGGSIRFPSHYCGVFGHKPSFGTVPAAGHTYPGQDADVDINVVGPMARSALDLDAAMRLFSDRVLIDEPRQLTSDFTVGVMLDNPCGGEQDSELTSLLAQAIDKLRDDGLSITTKAIPIDFKRAQQNYLLLNYAATSLVDQASTSDHRPELTDTMSHGTWIELSNERDRIRTQWSDYFVDVDLVLCPASASAAPPHQIGVPFPEQTIPVNGRMVTNFDQWFWAGIASGSYLPATVAPVGQTAAGLPVGMQIVAPFAHDLRGIRFAQLVEAVCGGFQPPAMAADRT